LTTESLSFTDKIGADPRVCFPRRNRKEEIQMGSAIKSPFMKYVAGYLIVAMFVIGVTPRVYADFSPSEVMGSASDRASDLQKIQSVIEMKMVGERLKTLGFTEEEINKKLNQLSDSQLHQLALQLDELRVGGGGAEVVIIILLLVIIAGLILYLTGHRIFVTKQK
jgi:hypothetical protein